MRSRIVGLCVVLVLGVFRAQAETPAVPLEFQPAALDLGTVPNDRITHAEISVRNRGNRPVQISKVQSSCGCVIGELDRTALEPGASAKLTVTVAPDQVHGFDIDMPLVLVIDQAPKLVPVAVNGKIDPEYVLDPPVLDFGVVEKAKGAELKFLIRQAGDKPIAVTRVWPWDRAPGLQLHLEEVPPERRKDPARREYLVAAVLAPDAPAGDHTDFVYVDTSSPRVPRMPFRIHAIVTAPYTVVPRNVGIGVLRPGESKSGVVEVKADDRLAVSSLQSRSGSLAWTARPSHDGKSAVLDVAVAATAPPGRLDDELSFVIRVSGADNRETVRVRGRIVP